MSEELDEAREELEDKISALQLAVLNLPNRLDLTPGSEGWSEIEEAKELVREIGRALLQVEKLYNEQGQE